MEQRRHRAQREFPLKAQRYINKNRSKSNQHRQPALLCQLLTDLRPDKLHAAQLHIVATSFPQQTQNITAQLGLADVASGRETHQNIVRCAEVLNDGFWVSRFRQIGAHLRQIDGLRISNLDERAAGEVDTVVEPAHTERDKRHEQKHT